MLLRLRSRDGLERVEVKDDATLAHLKQAIHDQLGVPLSGLQLSRKPELTTGKPTQASLDDLAVPDNTFLKALGMAHGEMLFMLYSGERVVDLTTTMTKTVKPAPSRPFGSCMTVADIAAKHARIERQDKAVVEAISFDRDAANMFQQYVNGVLQFSIKRGGLLYGTVSPEEGIKVEFIYEPPQQGTPMTLNMERGTAEEEQVDYLAGLLGLQKVGWIFTQSTAERDFIMHTEELIQTAQIQGELGDKQCMTVVVSWDREADEPGGHIHFEAFQCSSQCVQLVRDGWFPAVPEGQQPSGVSTLRNPKDPTFQDPVIIAGKDGSTVDNDYFLVPARILQHKGPLLTSFPIENRLLAQGKAELREHLRRYASKSYVERLSDFHLLLWLSKQPHLDKSDMQLLVDAVKRGAPVREGYQVIIDSIAGM